ncbi:hypothetical protein [Clostridium sp.]|uniref:hypothetical protein n=1 Tax=Clostridium sp. TaxID=1506 RepID=UPI0026380766|nr:hypothetical protein [Clostridium sp.]
MAFLDEKIAKLQKEARMAKKYSISNEEEHEEIQEENTIELSQEEVIQGIKSGALKLNEEELVFEKKECFGGKIAIPIINNFFDECFEDEVNYCWNKKHEFSISLSKMEFKDDITDIDSLVENIKGSFKENDIYIDILDSKEEINEKFNKYIITSKMPTALDYIFQYIVYVKFKDEVFNLILTCLEKDKTQWEKVIVGISELMEINEGDKENNE